MVLCGFQVTKVRPTSQEAKKKFDDCSKIVKRIAFEKAISVDHSKKSIIESLDIEGMSKFKSIIMFTIFRVRLFALYGHVRDHF